jgi:GTP cyclohydrolase IA
MEQRNIRNLGLRDNEKIMSAIKTIITEIGDDPNRAGLIRTPARFAKACEEWFGGYKIKPEDILDRTFPSEGYEDMVVIKDIDFTSFCEHHIALFPGVAHIGIVYADKIGGLDKYAKLVDIYARRLQTQEVMTQQIGDAIKKVLKPVGIIVVVEGKHFCVSSRETKQKDLKFITTYRYGIFKSDKHLESRFMQYIK